MSDKRISELTAATAAGASDQLPLVQSGTTKSITVSALVLEFDTVAGSASTALRAAPTPSTARTARVRGYYAAGDGGGGDFYWSASSTATDNGGTVILPTGHSGAGRWLLIHNNTVTLRQFGAKGDGTTDDIAARDNAITAFTSTGGTIYGDRRDTYLFSTGCTVPNGVTLDLRGALVKPSANVDLFTLREGGLLRDLKVNATAITYSSTVIKLSPTQNVRGIEWPQPWVDGYQGWLSSGAGNGTHVLFDASSFYIQETILDNIVCNKGEYGVRHSVGASKWSNGNIVKGLVCDDPVYAIREDAGSGELAGNCYYAMFERGSNNCEVQLNTRSTVHGVFFDRAKLTFTSNENTVIGAPLLLEDDLTDSGYNNRVLGTDVEYYDGRSITSYGDARNANTLPGEVEFREFFFGGTIDARWTASGTGSSSFSTTTSTGASEELSRVRYRMDTGTSTNDTRQISFGTAAIKTGHKPRLHATFQHGAATNQKVRFGLWSSATNHIIFESDQANTRWLALTTAGGVTTTTNLTANFNRLQFLSIIVQTNGSILFRHGEAAFSNNACALGVNNFSQSATHTTNIPTGTFMAPLVYVETLTTAAATLFTYDVQVLHSVYSDKP